MDFDFNMFNYVLHAVPANHIRPEAGEHSPYLQQALFDPLIQGKSIQLASLDWAAFDLRHVTLENYQAFFLEGNKPESKQIFASFPHLCRKNENSFERVNHVQLRV